MTLSYFVDVDEVRTEDAILYAAPMSHGAGLYNFMHVLRGARHVVPESGGFDAGEILTLARRSARSRCSPHRPWCAVWSMVAKAHRQGRGLAHHRLCRRADV
jgi:acyl-CoA synthetase (AMP-forming)/AMP-acid ligase II